MALFLEYSDKVRNKKYPITKPVRQHASALYNALEKLVPKNNLKGLKDLATPKKYNVKGADSKNNGQNTNVKFITTDDAVKRLQRGGYAVGDAFIQKFLDKCVDKSTSQEEVSPVEPPKPTSNAVKPPKVTTKTIEGGNGTVSYNESKEGKKVYLSEESIKRLCEYYTQLNIPFNDPNKPYDDKQNYEHFIDWLEYVGKYGQLPPSKADVSELIRAAFQDGFQHYLNDDLEDDNFIYNARLAMNGLFNECDGDEDYLRLYFNLPEEWYTNPPDNITDYLEEMGWDNDVVEMKNVLTDEGGEKFNSKMEDYFKGSLENYGFPNKMTRDERGLIYVEREIILPDIFSTEVRNFNEHKNYFELLRNSYKGSGPCWTWAVGHGEAYCGHSFGQSNTAVLLRGWVDPMSVDWGETLYRNAYSLNEERELYLKEGCIIEIDEVVVNDYGYKLNGKHILNKPMLIPI